MGQARHGLWGKPGPEQCSSTVHSAVKESGESNVHKMLHLELHWGKKNSSWNLPLPGEYHTGPLPKYFCSAALVLVSCYVQWHSVRLDRPSAPSPFPVPRFRCGLYLSVISAPAILTAMFIKAWKKNKLNCVQFYRFISCRAKRAARKPWASRLKDFYSCTKEHAWS